MEYESDYCQCGNPAEMAYNGEPMCWRCYNNQ